jgi:hypothetical protein
MLGATLAWGAFTLVTPVVWLISGFATSAFLVAVRLLIKDFFWIAMEKSSRLVFRFSTATQPTMSISLAKAQPAWRPG